MNVDRSPRVAVLGAGLTGVATALELAARGVDVTLIEQDEVAMNRASLRNEGKIHLGLIYAHDRSLRTARLQLQGALEFRALLSRWIGIDASRLRRSTPFVYLVANDSVVGAEELEAHYASIDKMHAELLAESDAYDYLGERARTLYRRCPLAEIEPFFRTARLSAAFSTTERAIDPEHLALRLRAAVRDAARIRFLPRHTVSSVSCRSTGYRVEGTGADGPWKLDADQVVNACWEGRLAIDASLGIAAEPGWLYRLKYRVIGRLPERLRSGPSATIVLGRYGDVVVRPDGTAYLSWYPASLAGWSHELSPPDAWQASCRGEAAEPQRKKIASELLAGLDAWYPGIGQAHPLIVDAGVIVAYGRTDVDDVGSALHDRSRIGVSSVDGYHSIDPGKLTTAPLFAKHAAERVLGIPRAE